MQLNIGSINPSFGSSELSKDKFNLDTERVKTELRQIETSLKIIEMRSFLWGHSNTFEQHSEKVAKSSFDANSIINYVCHTWEKEQAQPGHRKSSSRT